MLDASAGPGGSWPRYYDSLTLFSPARFSALPGMPFPVTRSGIRCATRWSTTSHAYAARLDADVRFGSGSTRVRRSATAVRRVDGGRRGGRGAGWWWRPAAGSAAVPAAAAGPGHVHRHGAALGATTAGPAPFAGGRVVVVGGGNSAVQIAVELAAGRHGDDQHPAAGCGGSRSGSWAGTSTGGWPAPAWTPARLGPRLAKGGVPVIDDGRYRAAVAAGRPDHRPLFSRLDGDGVVWADGTRERVDVLVLATGYRPDLRLPGRHGALDEAGHRCIDGGVSATVPGLGYVGLERQRSFASATLRGVGRDAAHVLGRRSAGAGGTRGPVSVAALGAAAGRVDDGGRYRGDARPTCAPSAARPAVLVLAVVVNVVVVPGLAVAACAAGRSRPRTPRSGSCWPPRRRAAGPVRC